LSTQAVATFTDPGGPEPIGNYTATINWGDGSSSAGTISLGGSTFMVSGSHTYGEEGSYTTSVTIAHESAPTTTITGGAATVTDPAVLASPFSPPAAQVPALSTQAVATFTDPGGPEAIGNYTATIAWGDGSSSVGTISLSG